MAELRIEERELEKYYSWLEEKHGCRHIRTELENRYNVLIATAVESFTKSEYWSTLTEMLSPIGQKYQLDRGYPLLANSDMPIIHKKPYRSFLIKTYRKNMLNNPKWPDEPPEGGWLLPLECLPKINDLIRTMIAVKYLDGVGYLVDSIAAICTKQSIEHHVDYEAKEEGYYAAHFYINHVAAVPTADWLTKDQTFQVELQVTTQLQEVIRVLLHKYYEKRRICIESSGQKWQWEYHSDEFATNYLGHILHYIEGMIMDVRDKRTECGGE